MMLSFREIVVMYPSVMYSVVPSPFRFSMRTYIPQSTEPVDESDHPAKDDFRHPSFGTENLNDPASLTFLTMTGWEVISSVTS